MDPTAFALIYAGIGLVQGLVLSALWATLFYRTGHGAEWFLVALLPLSGLWVAPFVTVFTTMLVPFNPDAIPWQSVATSFVTFLFSTAPLAVLVIRVMMGKVRVGQS